MWLPAIAAVAVTGKESFLPLGAAFAGGWLLASWRHEARRSLAVMSIAFMVLSGAIALTLLAATRGHPMLWMSTPALASMTLADYGTTITWLVTDRGLLYVFGWLLPLAVPSLRLLPAPWRAGTLAAAAMAFALGVVGGEQSVNRALMNVAGPLLCAAAALTVLRVAQAAHAEAPPSAAKTASTESQTNGARRG